MKFTPSQVRSIVGLSDETLRYWKKRLSPLMNKRGHSPCYTHGELLALMVLHLLVKRFGMEISLFAPHAEALFQACHQSQWLRISDILLVVTPTKSEISFIKTITAKDSFEPSILIPLHIVLNELKLNLVKQDDDISQLELSWPPVGLDSLPRKESA